MQNTRYTFLRRSSLCLTFLLAFTPDGILAQAGSFPAISLESSSGGGSGTLQSFSESSTGEYGSVEATSEPQRPQGVLKLGEDQRYLIWVELLKGRLNVMEVQEHGGLITRKIVPISIGKNGYGKEREGDKLTPVGVYRLTSFLEDANLDDFYGDGAFPMNYPNAHDRLQGRTGHGIWLHGLPKNTNQRPLLDSDGCVVVDNPSLQSLTDYIQTGTTYIVLSEQEIQWAPVNDTKQRTAELEQAFETWRRDWESRKNTAYLSHYADDFSDLNRDKESWSSYKSMVNNGKNFINVETSRTSFIADPRDDSLVTVRFYQRYRSNNHNWNGWKEQLWQETGAGWKILYEGNG